MWRSRFLDNHTTNEHNQNSELLPLQFHSNELLGSGHIASAAGIEQLVTLIF